MKQFAGHRSSQEIRRLCREQGLHCDMRTYRKGGDCITVSGGGCTVVYNVVNGRFTGRTPHPHTLFTESNGDLEGTPWYDALLGFFYYEGVPSKAITRAVEAPPVPAPATATSRTEFSPAMEAVLRRLQGKTGRKLDKAIRREYERVGFMAHEISKALAVRECEQRGQGRLAL